MGDGFNLTSISSDVNAFASNANQLNTALGGNTIGSNTTIENSISNSLTSAIGPAAAVNPIAGAAVAIAAGVAKIVSAFFKGANPNQVYSAETEQIFEAAADNIFSLVKAGYFSIDVGVTMVQALVTQGTTAMNQLQGKIGNLGGMQNMLTTLNNEIGDIQSAAIIPLVSFNYSQVQNLYIQPNTSGWYSNSLQQAIQLTNQLVSEYSSYISGTGNYQQASNTGITSTVNSISTALSTGNISGITSIVSANPITTLIIILIVYWLLVRRSV